MSLTDRLKRLFGADTPRSPVGGEPGGEGISCREALTVMYEYLDGALEGVTEAQVRTHFEVCSRCYPHLRLEERFRGALQRAGTGDVAPPALKDRLKEMLAEADAG